MAEQLIIDLFFAHRPNAEGVLGEEEVFKLNRTLARLNIERSGDTSAPPPEPLPKGPMRFPAFRNSMHRALAGLGAGAAEKEKLLADLVARAQSAEEEGRAPGGFEVNGGLDFGLPPPLPVGEPEVNLVEEAPVAVSCWDPSMLSEEHRQKLQPYISAVTDARNSDATQKTLEAAKTLGSLAIRSSKQVLETAREYGLQALVGAQSFNAQSLSEKLRAADEEYCTIHPGRRPVPPARQTGEPKAFPRLQERGVEPCVEMAPVKGAASEDAPLPAASASLPQQRRQLQFDLPSPPPQPFEQHRAEAAIRQQRPAYRTQTAQFGRPDIWQSPYEIDAPTTWRFDAGDGLHMDVRATPDVGAARTGKYLLSGEAFTVSQELHGRDGVLYLRLADGRGWVFESKPGVGKMCFRASDRGLSARLS